MSDVPIPAEREPQIVRTNLPLLRIHHLMAWMAVTAVLLTTHQYGQRLYSGDVEIPGALEFVSQGSGAVGAILQAAAITCVLFGLYWRKHGITFFTQPGHWLMVLTTIYAAVGLVMWIPFYLLQPSFGGPSQRPDMARLLAFFLGTAAFVILMLGVTIYVGRTKCTAPHWRKIFYWKAASMVIPFLIIVQFLLLLSVMRGDRRQGLPWDRAHWLGAWLEVVVAVFGFLAGSVGALAGFYGAMA